MKKALGYYWKFKNSSGKVLKWSAELRTKNEVFFVHNQKKLKSAIAIANKAAKQLGWEMTIPWIAKLK